MIALTEFYFFESATHVPKGNGGYSIRYLTVGTRCSAKNVHFNYILVRLLAASFSIELFQHLARGKRLKRKEGKSRFSPQRPNTQVKSDSRESSAAQRLLRPCETFCDWSIQPIVLANPRIVSSLLPGGCNSKTFAGHRKRVYLGA